MREKKTKKPVKEEQKSNNTAYLWTLAIIIVIGVAIYYFSRPVPLQNNEADYAIYNNYIFQKTELGWGTMLKTGAGDQGYEFYYHPLDVENESFNLSILFYMKNVILNNGNISIAFTPEIRTEGKSAIAGVEISKVTGIYGFPTKAGLTEINAEIAQEMIDDNVTYPIFNCTIANSKNAVIEFHLGNETKIESKKYCTIITGTDLDELIRMADLLSYKIIGIIK